jgi:hypothetical protein
MSQTTDPEDEGRVHIKVKLSEETIQLLESVAPREDWGEIISDLIMQHLPLAPGEKEGA